MNRYVGCDPYLMKMGEFSVELKDLLTVEAVDITNYLVLQTSYYTRHQIKAYKSLEAYNFFVRGWVHDLGTKQLYHDHCLVFARVSVCSYIDLCVKMPAVAAIISTNMQHILTMTGKGKGLCWSSLSFILCPR